MTTPEKRAAKAAYMRQWRRQNPEAARAADRRRYAAVRADPERLAHHREYHAAVKRRLYATNPKVIRRNQRNSYLRTQYGIEPDEYDALIQGQGGHCALCPCGPTEKRPWLCVDHDHETGRIRGLLCDRCNRGLGLLHDDIDLLKRAILYLGKWVAA